MEPSTWRTDEHPDVLGWTPHALSTLIECKVSREDWRRERAKPHRRRARPGMGDCRYYLAPEGVVGEEDLPEGYGLLHPGPRGTVQVVREAACRPADSQSLREELTLALMQLERSLRGVHTHALPMPAWEEPAKSPVVSWRAGYSPRYKRLVDRRGQTLGEAHERGDWVARSRKGEVVGMGTAGGETAEARLAGAKQLVMEALVRAKVLRKELSE